MVIMSALVIVCVDYRFSDLICFACSFIFCLWHFMNGMKTLFHVRSNWNSISRECMHRNSHTKVPCVVYRSRNIAATTRISLVQFSSVSCVVQILAVLPSGSFSKKSSKTFSPFIQSFIISHEDLGMLKHTLSAVRDDTQHGSMSAGFSQMGRCFH